MIPRRTFLQALVAAAGLGAINEDVGNGRGPARAAPRPAAVALPPVRADEDLFAYLRRLRGAFDPRFYRQILGAANAFKEGDAIVGVAAADETSRARARRLLAHTRVADIDAHPPLRDRLFALLRQTQDVRAVGRTAGLTLGDLKAFLLSRDAPAIKAVMPGLSSDVIGCVVKLMANTELIALGAKVFNPLPGSRIGARGYLGARIQPN